MISAPREIDELWSLRVNPSDLHNIERPIGDGPATGGGQLYIQVGQRMVGNLLRFLDEPYPENVPINLTVHSICRGGSIDAIQFDKKSQGRMRIPNQNRYRAHRLQAWSPDEGFPSLAAGGASTEDAASLLDSLGGLHIFLARDKDGTIWAGFQLGMADAILPFAAIISGNHEGGYWSETLGVIQ